MPGLAVQARQHPRRLGKDQVGDDQLVERLQPAIGLNRVGPLQPGHVVVDLAIAVAVGRAHPPELGAVRADDQRHGRLTPGLEGGLDRGRHDATVDQGQVAVGEHRRRRQEQVGRRRAQVRRRAKAGAIGPDLAPFARGRSAVRSLSVQRRLQFSTQSRLDHGPVEQAPRGRRDHQPRHDGPARRFAEDGDVPGVAAEGRDIGAHPFQRRRHVHQAIVRGRLAGRSLGGQRRMIEEAQPPQPIIQADDHHAPPGQGRSVVQRRGAGAVDHPPAVNPHHDRRRLTGAGRPPDVQVQTVLAHRQRADAGIAAGRRLDADRPIDAGVALTLPGRRGAGRPPPSRSRRRRGVGNVLERNHVAVGASGQDALRNADGGLVGCGRHHEREGGEDAGDCHPR